MSYWKPCPKCETGTVRTSTDRYGDYLRCINCGMTADLPVGVATYSQVQRHLQALCRVYDGVVPVPVAPAPVEALPATAAFRETALAA